MFLYCRAEGSNLLLDPHLVCKVTRRFRAKPQHDLCKNETSLIKEISRGISMGFKECEYQFKNRRWNCTSNKKNMRKILIKGKCPTLIDSSILNSDTFKEINFHLPISAFQCSLKNSIVIFLSYCCLLLTEKI